MNMKLVRIKKEIKQRDFARMLGITPQHLRKIEKGEVDIKKSFMVEVSKLLEVSVQELFFSEDD